MKTISIILATIILTTVSYGQNVLKTVKNQVGNTDILKTWDLNETIKSNGNEITRIEGNDPYHRTNILYTTFDQVFDDVNSIVALDGLTGTEKCEVVDIYKGITAGGQIALFMDRDSEAEVDLGNFSLIVTNISESEIIYSEKLDSEPGQYYSPGIWYNFITISIPNPVNETFVVTLMDETNNTLFKYFVSREVSNHNLISKK